MADSREFARSVSSPAPLAIAPDEPPCSSLMLRLSSADQAIEVLAAMSINKTQLAEVLGVSRTTLNNWLDGKAPHAANEKKLTTLVELLKNAGVTSANSLAPRFVRQPLTDGVPSLLEALSTEPLDEKLVFKLMQEARSLGEAAEARRLSKEERLRALGFEEPTDEQCKEQLAINIALREWPKD